MAWVGKSLQRKEDERLIRGNGLFVDDEMAEGMLHLYILRSPYAHARIRSIDTSAAEALEGVACVLTGEEVKQQCDPFMQLGPEPCDKIIDLPLATDKVVFQGQPVAAVAAETAAIAMDAGLMIEVDYEMLDAVVDPEAGSRRQNHPARRRRHQPHLEWRIRIRRGRPGVCRCRARGEDRPPAFSPLCQHSSGKQWRRRQLVTPG